MDAGVARGHTDPDETALRERLIGTWRLRNWHAYDVAGERQQPFGPDPLGYVVYTADGRMITTIGRARREPIGGDLLSAPDAGRSAAFASFVAYAGTFEVEGGDVIHRVEMSLFPDWVGSVQRRHVEMSTDGADLVLRPELATAAGGAARHELHWRRVTA